MQLHNYYNEDNGYIRISANQASRFAKEVADDFNPIHDPDAKRFCVPGDLLFSMVLDRYGLSQDMTFAFVGPVGDGTPLLFPESPGTSFSIDNEAGKVCMEVNRSGRTSRDPAQIEALTKKYVAFSGHNFPHILVPLMAKHQVMINPERPLVMYQSMSVHFDDLDFSDPELALSTTSLEVRGKRGDATLEFDVIANGRRVGHGGKKLAISGLQDYDADTSSRLSAFYEQRKQDYRASL